MDRHPISLAHMTIEQALKKAMDAGPYLKNGEPRPKPTPADFSAVPSQLSTVNGEQYTPPHAHRLRLRRRPLPHALR